MNDARRRTRLAIVAAAAGMSALAPLLDLVRHGPVRLFSYFAPDAFYYLTVARNRAATGQWSFDQSHPTNGFHPLWQWLLGGLARALPTDLDPIVPMLTAFLAGAALLALAAACLTWSGLLWTRRVGALWLGLPVGVYGVIAAWAGLDRWYPTLWYAINGMETALSLCLFAMLAALMLTTRPVGRRPWGRIGVVLGLLVLARLDTVFLLPAFAATIALESLGNRPAWRGGIRSLAVASLMIAAYLIYNRLVFGVAFPVSGSLKSTFPRAIGENWRAWHDYLRQGAAWPPGSETGERLFQLFIPFWIVLADQVLELLLALLARRDRWRSNAWRRVLTSRVGDPRLALFLRGWLRSAARAMTRQPWRRWLTMCRLFVIALHCYNIRYVQLWDQGFWYFALSQTILTLLAIDRLAFLARALRRRMPGRLPRAALGWGVAALLIAGQAAWFHVNLYRNPHHDYFLRLYRASGRVTAYYAGRSPRLVVLDDGATAFFTGWPAMAGLGLNLDAAAVPAFRQRALLRLALARGYDRVATRIHEAGRGLTPQSPPPEVLSAIKADDAVLLTFHAHDLRGLEFQLEFLAPDVPFAIFRFHAVQPTGETPGR